MTPGPTRDVVLSIADERARAHVARAVHLARLRGREVHADRLTVDIAGPNPPVAVAYDLHPGGRRGLARFLSLKRRLPYVPVRLYPPSAPGIGALVARCSRVPLVHVELQNGSGDSARLHVALQYLIQSTPTHAFLRLLADALRACPRRTVAFVAELLRRLSRDGAGAMTVTAIARRLGTTQRTLERQWRSATALTPRELRDWTILLLVESERRGNGVASVAAQFGIDPQRFYRIRDRLIERHLEPEGVQRDFAALLRAFRRRCRTIVIR